MIKIKSLSNVFAVLLLVVIFSFPVLGNEQVSSSVSLASLEMDSDNLLVGRNPQTGKEIQIAARYADVDDDFFTSASSAKIVLGDVEYFADVKVSMIELVDIIDSSNYRCGVSKNNEVVCEVTPNDGSDASMISDDNSLYCWGNNEFRSCPDEEIIQSSDSRGKGGGAGKVSVQDINIKSSSESEGEIEILSWSWGHSSLRSEPVDPDEEVVELSYVWFVNSEPESSSDDVPSESLSLSFSKVELAFENEDSDGFIEVDFPVVEVSKNSIVFTSITFDEFAFSQGGERCRVYSILYSDDCDDLDNEVRPSVVVDGSDGFSKADAKRALDEFSAKISSIQSSLERCDLDVCKQVGLNADKRHGLVNRAKEDVVNSPPVVSEVRGIVLEDIDSLSNCDDEVCREVLLEERELLRMVDSLIVSIANSGDTIWPSEWLDMNISLSRYEEANNEDSSLVSERQRPRLPEHVVDRATPVLFSAGRGDRFSDEEREELREYLSSLGDVRGRDFGLSVALLASENPRVREVRFNEQTNMVEIEHDEELRLLGFIRMNARVHTMIDEAGNENTRRPWWSFLASSSGERVRFKAGADMSKSVN